MRSRESESALSDREGFRFARPRVGIAHQSVMIGDAIGNDISGQCRLLERLAFRSR